MSATVYANSLTVMSVVIVIFGAWLLVMMGITAKDTGKLEGQDIASFTYILSSVLVFLIIAVRAIFEWPREAILSVIALKAVSVVAVSIWYRLGMPGGRSMGRHIRLWWARHSPTIPRK